jgi:hypothetical protein
VEQLEDRCVPAGMAPSVQDQVFLELLNAARANPAAYGNSIGLDLSGVAPSQPLAWDPLLIQAAEGHSQDMSTQNYFSHYTLGGQDPGARITATGYSWSSWGESIAAGYASPAEALKALIIDAGVSDLGHRLHLLAMTPTFQGQTQVGIGVVLNGTGTYRDYYTIDTAQPYSNHNAFVTGVVYNDANGNGLYDAGEGLGGVTVTVQGVGSMTTYSTGGYQFQVAPGTYTVTFSGGNLVSPVTRSVTVGSTNVEVDVGQTSQQVANQYVQTLWQSYLKRSPSSTELATYSNSLLNGTFTQASLAQLVKSSSEYQSVATSWLKQAYQDLLGRSISATEINSWLTWLRNSSGTLNDVDGAILGSTEYQNRVWGGWVQSAYQTYLHRSASAGEVSSWDSLFQKGMTQSCFLGYIIGSAEAQSQFSSDSQFVAAMYTDLLGRSASSTEINNWLARLQISSRAAVTAGFLASYEYQWHQDCVAVQQIYQNWLGRSAGSNEVNTFAAGLYNGGTSLLALEKMVLDSVEYYNRAKSNYP